MPACSVHGENVPGRRGAGGAWCCAVVITSWYSCSVCGIIPSSKVGRTPAGTMFHVPPCGKHVEHYEVPCDEELH